MGWMIYRSCWCTNTHNKTLFFLTYFGSVCCMPVTSISFMLACYLLVAIAFTLSWVSQ